MKWIFLKSITYDTCLKYCRNLTRNLCKSNSQQASLKISSLVMLSIRKVGQTPDVGPGCLPDEGKCPKLDSHCNKFQQFGDITLFQKL